MPYPREVGSDKVVHEDDWNQESPVGYCPACGSIGIEELHVAGDEAICFYCSDTTCLTIMGKRAPARTKWNQDKPADMQKKEKESGWTWNAEHFPGKTFPMACPD